MKNKFARYILIAIVLAPMVIFVAKFGEPSILKTYVRAGMAHSQNLAIFSLEPEPENYNLSVDETFLNKLKRYRLPQMDILLPKNIKAVEGETSITYYKKKPGRSYKPIAYLLYEKPGFFMDLFPHLKKQGITNDHDFLSRTMAAKIDDIKTVTDAFFVIMKGVFTPDMEEQKNLKMIKFSCDGKDGFISYNMDGKTNYFDCNFFDRAGNFFKVYIKDPSASLDLNKICTIISTAKKNK
ncbi:MAG: hypothetical protein NTV07_03420 [Candidatus Omnitrophica bacterium]|nr:hypothetical protein [Candidatus Omnitrophota bacterium]